MTTLLTLTAGFSAPRYDLKDAYWLIGNWENKTPRGIIYESWVLQKEQLLTAKSYAVKNGDTMVFEEVQLLQEQGDIFYIPVVQGQNNEEPVRFKLSSMTAKELVFENPAHDFPQKISYRRIENDSLLAEISGNKGGKFRSQRFPMKRLR